ncbi:MAG: CehA/McbA family metallohydrolase [Actinomycetes bacterium]
MTGVRHSGRWTPDDRAAGVYHYLPVEVPPHASGLQVRLDYDRSGAVLDLGCEAPAGWRGWSGGARSSYVITARAATPGYLPGELEPGTWQVVLGLHRVPADGVAFEVTVEVSPAGAAPPRVEPDPPVPPRAARPPRRELPAVDGLTWRPGDFHAHTLHSDGSLSVPDLAHLAASQGLDFLAVTDHNTTSHHAGLDLAGRAAGIQLVAGQEVTTGFGHANAFGDIGWVDFRQPAETWWPVVESRGGLLSVNHPLGGDCSWRQAVTWRAPLAEIWHSSWRDRRWGGPLAWWQSWDGTVTPLGGSDFHRHPDAAPGTPTTWVACEGDDVLGGLRAGRVAISDSPAGPLLLRVGDELVALGADGALLTGPDGRRRTVRSERAVFPAPVGPCWLEDGDTRVVAISA